MRLKPKCVYCSVGGDRPTACLQSVIAASNTKDPLFPLTAIAHEINCSLLPFIRSRSVHTFVFMLYTKVHLFGIVFAM